MAQGAIFLPENPDELCDGLRLKKSKKKKVEMIPIDLMMILLP